MMIIEIDHKLPMSTMIFMICLHLCAGINIRPHLPGEGLLFLMNILTGGVRQSGRYGPEAYRELRLSMGTHGSAHCCELQVSLGRLGPKHMP